MPCDPADGRPIGRGTGPGLRVTDAAHPSYAWTLSEARVAGRPGEMLTVVILTRNEEVHIQRAVENVRGWAADVFVVDSLSDDRTCEIAQAAGARVFPHAFENYSTQREWALRSLPFQTEWILFLDADELLSDALKTELTQQLLVVPDRVHGLYVNRRLYWMGRWLRHGGLYPSWILRVARHRHARCGARSVNEHLEVEGEVGKLCSPLLHVELKSLSEWVAKHNRYATLEAEEAYKLDRARREQLSGRLWGSQPQRKQWIREHVWGPLLPPLLRPVLLFLYGYVLRLGFLDGMPGATYHVLQRLCYGFMIEIKYLALRSQGSERMNPELIPRFSGGSGARGAASADDLEKRPDVAADPE